MSTCRSCGSANPADSDFCGVCGTRLGAADVVVAAPSTVDPLYCGTCGAQNLADAQACAVCGSPLSQGTAFAVTTSTPYTARAAAVAPVVAPRQPSKRPNMLVGAALALLVVAGGFGIWRFSAPPSAQVAARDTAQPALAMAASALPSKPAAAPADDTRAAAQASAEPAPTSKPQPVAVVAPTTAAAAPTATVAAAPTLVLGPETKQTPAQVSASGNAPSSVDNAGNQTTFVPENVADGLPDTAWRVAGDGRGALLELRFAAPVLLSEVQLIPGYAKRDPATGIDRFMQNRRVRRVRLEFSDGSIREAAFAEDPQLQSVAVGSVLTTFVRIVVLETSEPGANDGRDFTPISEVVLIGKAVQ